MAFEWRYEWQELNYDRSRVSKFQRKPTIAKALSCEWEKGGWEAERRTVWLQPREWREQVAERFREGSRGSSCRALQATGSSWTFHQSTMGTLGGFYTKWLIWFIRYMLVSSFPSGWWLSSFPIPSPNLWQILIFTYGPKKKETSLKRAGNSSQPIQSQCCHHGVPTVKTMVR